MTRAAARSTARRRDGRASRRRLPVAVLAAAQLLVAANGAVAAVVLSRDDGCDPAGPLVASVVRARLAEAGAPAARLGTADAGDGGQFVAADVLISERGATATAVLWVSATGDVPYASTALPQDRLAAGLLGVPVQRRGDATGRADAVRCLTARRERAPRGD